MRVSRSFSFPMFGIQHLIIELEVCVCVRERIVNIQFVVIILLVLTSVIHFMHINTKKQNIKIHKVIKKTR